MKQFLTEAPIPLWPDADIPLMKYHGRRERHIPEESPITLISGVNYPSLQPFLPATGRRWPAVVVCPGGAYDVLAIDYEGTEIAEKLAALGLAAFVLRYRVPKQRAAALCDAQRAIRLLRGRAAEFGLCKSRIGILGFSAGGHLAVSCANSFDRDCYPKKDALDRVSSRPDFCAGIYPAYLEEPQEWKYSRRTPPTFLLQAQDDPFFPSLPSCQAGLLACGVPIECHIYPKGGHGFGSRVKEPPLAGWEKLFAGWAHRLFETKK